MKYGKSSQILRRNPTECMCVSARFNLTTLSYGLFPKIRYPRRYCCLLLLPAAFYHSHLGCTVES